MFYVDEYYHLVAPPLFDSSYPDLLRDHTHEIHEIQRFHHKATTTHDGGVVVLVDDRRETASRHDAVQYLVDLRHAVGDTQGDVRWCLFHAIQPDDTLESLETWYVRHYPLFDALVVLDHDLNPLKVDTVIPHFMSLALSHPLFGSVLIADDPRETQRCLDRQRRGVRFFVSTLQLYPTPQWQYLVHLLGHRLITRTTVPASKQQLDVHTDILDVHTDAYEGLYDTLENNVARCLQWLQGVSYAFEILGETHRRKYLDALLSHQ